MKSLACFIVLDCVKITLTILQLYLVKIQGKSLDYGKIHVFLVSPEHLAKVNYCAQKILIQKKNYTNLKKARG